MKEYLLHTEKSFDEISGAFDEEDSSNAILQWMRKQMYDIYEKNFKSGDNILELNAGTGIDAFYLASLGMKICATDISAKMLEKLEMKINDNKLKERITSYKVSFDEIGSIDEDNFDGVISNFGGLNCVDDFSTLREALASKIRSGGKFIAAVMNTFCPWEVLYFLLKLDPDNALRRFDKNGIEANLSRFKIKSFYFTPREFEQQFIKYFEPEKVYSLGLLTPPPYLFGIYRRFPSVIKLLMNADSSIKGLFPLNRAGDHFISVMKRR